MDIIDVLVSLALTPQGQISTYITQVQNALDRAESILGNAEGIQDMIDASIANVKTNLGAENAGAIVIVGPDGEITAGEITADSLVEVLIKSGSYIAKDAVGLDIDYENRTFTRTQEAMYLTPGNNFATYAMYGGRKRCNVADDGTITAFYGDPSYTEDGSNGQVMVYQPKFYYSRVPTKLGSATMGQIIRKESIMISPHAQSGFKLHPLFIAEDGSELEYVLLPAYDGCAYDTSANAYDYNDSSYIVAAEDKLSSIAGAKPISGVNKTFTIASAEQMAQNRGEGWHITNLAAESALQFLLLVEYGSLNGQSSIEQGICSIPNNVSRNCASITGSTSSLGDATGAAESTTNEVGGSYNNYTTDGRRAISYRGQENPWGNIWQMIGGLNIKGNGGVGGGIPYICLDFNYNPQNIESNYETLGVMLPSKYDYASGFGYSIPKYDWVFIPVECTDANSALPIGDIIWTSEDLNGMRMAMFGGSWALGDRNGLFSYAFDQAPTASHRTNSARLMFIPTKNEIYESNIEKWQRAYQGVDEE